MQKIKTKERQMRIKSNDEDNLESLPPIRAELKCSENQISVKNKKNRITATDYNRWDKFDAGNYFEINILSSFRLYFYLFVMNLNFFLFRFVTFQIRNV